MKTLSSKAEQEIRKLSAKHLKELSDEEPINCLGFLLDGGYITEEKCETLMRQYEWKGKEILSKELGKLGLYACSTGKQELRDENGRVCKKEGKQIYYYRYDIMPTGTIGCLGKFVRLHYEKGGILYMPNESGNFEKVGEYGSLKTAVRLIWLKIQKYNDQT